MHKTESNGKRSFSCRSKKKEEKYKIRSFTYSFIIHQVCKDKTFTLCAMFIAHKHKFTLLSVSINI